MKFHHAFLGEVTLSVPALGDYWPNVDPQDFVAVVDRHGDTTKARACTLTPIEETPPASTGSLNDLGDEILENNVAKGWVVPGVERNFGEQMALITSEVSEAYEHHRDGRGDTEVFYTEEGKPDGVPIEMADVIIRILGFCAEREIDIDGAVRVKMAFNKTRPYRHGGKKA